MRTVKWLVALWFFAGLLNPGVGLAQSGPPSPPIVSVSGWPFDDTTNWVTEEGEYPLTFTNITWSADWDNKALYMNNTHAAFLEYSMMYTNGQRTNLTLNAGTVWLWFSPVWASTNQSGGTGPGDWGRFIEAGTNNTANGWWSLYLSPDGCNLYFSSQSNATSGATYFSAPISWTSNSWHLIALTLSSSNTCLFLDGANVTNGAAVTYLPTTNVTKFFIGGDSGTGLAQARGEFDDIYTLSIPINAAFFTNYYARTSAKISAWQNGGGGNSPNGFFGGGFVNNCVTGGQVYLTNMTAVLNGSSGTTYTFTIAGGASGVPYDVFTTTNLTGNSITNAQWTWAGRGYTCNTYYLTSQMGTNAFYVLGDSTIDPDGDGLSTAFEMLVTKTDPNVFNSPLDGFGTPNAWYLMHGIDPTTASVGSLDPDADGLLNKQEYLYGTDPLVSEGFVVWVGIPGGFLGIP